MSTRREAFAAGVAAVVPMLPGIAPFGLVAGLTAIATGLSSVQALALSGLEDAPDSEATR